MNNIESFKRITDAMNDLYVKKNHDYGDSFHDTYVRLGIISAITRMSDKMNRIISLATKGTQKVKEESLRDTLIDIANYSVMTIMELDGEKPSAEESATDEKNLHRRFGLPY